MKILKRLIILILIIAAILFATSWFYLKNQSPQYSGQIKLQGIEKPVEILFDEYGIPHIYAETEKDAYFALGYTQAQERLFQMVLYRRLINGRAAEIFGPELIKTDKYFHTLGLYKLAKKAADRFFNNQNNAAYKEPAQAYLDGINAFISEDRLPIEFTMIGFTPEFFTPEDIYGSLNLTALGFSFAQREDLLMNYIYNDLGPEYFENWSEDFVINPKNPLAETALLMSSQLDESLNTVGLTLWEGSNGWVLAPSKTKSGKALLANDTHIGFAQPSVWYEAYINYPGYEFYGSFLPTCPYGVLGHNENLGWGLTIFPFDNMDYYLMDDLANDQQYLYFDDTLAYETEEIEIAVKGADNEIFTRKSSLFGPIVNTMDPFIDSVYQTNIALSWSLYYLDQTAVEALYKLNHATNFSSFQEALPLIDIVGLNVMYADKEDNIAWWACGKIPLRDSLSQSFTFLSSSDKTDQQYGFQDFHLNPSITNPKSGFIATANNNPIISGSHFERGNYLPADRINRIQNILEKKNDWDIESTKALQLDHKSDVKALLAHFIVEHFIDLPEEEKYQNAAKTLKDWDGNYDLDATAPIIFARMYYHIAKDAISDEMGPYLFSKAQSSYLLKKALPRLIYDENSPWWNNSKNDLLGTRDQILTHAFMTSIDELSRELGNNQKEWKWMDVHSLTHVHPIGKKKPFDKVFNVGPFPIAGGNQVINKMGYPLSDAAIHQITSGPAVRTIIDFAQVQEALNIIPTGQSGNIMSPHYDDQAQMYVDGIYRAMLMDKERILEGNHQKLSLIPQ